MFAVILAGGKGTRLWPVSRQKRPKQFHPFAGEKSLIRETYERLSPKFQTNEIFISTTRAYQKEIKKEIPEIPEENYIVEPKNMGTAAACGLASKIIEKKNPGSIVAFLPSDHTIKDNDQFLKTINFAQSLVKDYGDRIITIGIKPTKPDTSLGYINIDDQIVKNRDFSAFSVKKFVEKPELSKAKEYVKSWNFLWNAGMFVWKTDALLRLIDEHLPETAKALNKISLFIDNKEFEKVLEEEYPKVEETSLDYGILERTNQIMAIPGDFGWSDIGSWGSLLDYLGELHNTNVISRGHHVGVKDSKCLVMANDKLVATVGLKNIIIVDSPDAMLVCDQKFSGDVKLLLEKLEAEGLQFYL